MQDVWIAEIECILGLDFLGPNGCVIDVVDGCLQVGTQEIQLRHLGSKKQPKCRGVYVVETTTIPARSEALITGQLHDGEPVEEIWGSLEPTKKLVLPNEIILARTVIVLQKLTLC